jgi:hypothetical protein
VATATWQQSYATLKGPIRIHFDGQLAKDIVNHLAQIPAIA